MYGEDFHLEAAFEDAINEGGIEPEHDDLDPFDVDLYGDGEE